MEAQRQVHTQLQPDSSTPWHEIIFVDTGSQDLTASNDLSRTTTALRINADYELAPRSRRRGGVVRSARLVDDLRPIGGESFPREGRDTLNSLNLGARWAPTRNLQFGCDANASGVASAARRCLTPYSITSYGCNGQFMPQ